LMLQITREEAMRGLVDFGRVEDLLQRTKGRVDHVALTRVTPLAAPLFLEPGRIPVFGEGRERLLQDRAAELMTEAGLADL
jgi:ATP-dependent Lhr-like helicase